MKAILKLVGALAAICCFSSAWAADAPTITVDGTTVTINNETASTYATWSLGVNDNWQSKGFWLPNGTGLDEGKVVKVTSIAFAVPSDKVFCDKIGIAGCVSASAVRTEGGFTTAEADKVLFSFEDSECFLLAGSSSRVWFLDSNGAKIASTIWFRTGASAYQHIDNLVWSGSAPVVEIVGEIMTGSSITGSQDAIGNSGTDPLYAFDVTGYLDTSGNKTGPVVLVENNSGAYSIGVNNANSVNADGQHSTWSKLSGSGTLGTVANNKGGTYPVLEIYDSSEFTGTIKTGGVSGAPNLSVVFCAAEESDTLKGSYNNWFRNSYLTSLYVSEASVVTVPAGKTWQASKLVVEGEATINGTFNGAVVNNGSLTIKGTVTGTISGSGTVVVNEGATLASLGAQRDFTGWTIDSSVSAKITMTAEEYGKGSVSVTGANGIASITVLAPDGTTTVGTITPEEGAGTLETGVKVSGKACWYAWEMNGNLDGSGANTAGLSHDTGSSDQNAFYNSSMLYTYRHPYTSVAFPANWTAVVRCTVPKVVNGTVITFGTKFTSFIGLIAGDDPETEMKLVRYNDGDEAYTVLASMPILDGTSAQHVYIFSVENNSAVKVYCDGSLVLDDTFDTFSLGNGIQIGSAHGGVAGGLVRMWAGDTYAGLTTEDLEEARIDCVRLYDYSLSAEQIAALSTEFPSVTIYRATVEDEAATTWGALSWEPSWTGGNSLSKVILTTEGDATVALPETITADQIQLSLAADSTLTLAGPGSLTVTEPIDITGGMLELTGTVTLTRDTAFNGKVSFAQFTKAGDGAIQLANGATVGVDAALVVTPLGDYTCAEGTVVDSSYTGAGVKLMPLTSAACSLTSGTTVRYYSVSTGVFDTFKDELATDEALVYTILDDTDWSSYAGLMVTWGYYFDQAAGTIELAAATIAAQNKAYTSLSAAVADAAENAIVKLFRDSSEAITLNKAITLNENGKAFSGTLTGNGTLTFAAFRNNPSITFTDWTGTVVLPSFVADGLILNSYGTTGSTIALTEIESGWLNPANVNVAAKLRLDGPVNITAMSTRDYVFAEIDGTGNLSFATTGDQPSSVTITKVAKGYAGTITSTLTTTVTIGTLDRETGTSTEVETKLLDTTGDVVASALTVGGEPVDVRLVTEEDGIYVGAPIVAMIGETPYTSLAAAVEAATDGDTVTLLSDANMPAVEFDDKYGVPSAQGDSEIVINKAITLDGAGHTIYGVANYFTHEIADGCHDLFISGDKDVVIKNVTLSDFGGSAYVSKFTYPIWTGQGYTGTLVLDGVTVTNYNRTAFNFNGGTVVVTNCAVYGDAPTPRNVNGAYFQNGIGVLNANVTVYDSAFTGIGAYDPDHADSNSAECFQVVGAGSITVKSGSYAGQYIAIVGSDASGTIAIADGDFSGDLCVEEGSSGGISITGGTFDRDVNAFCADGYEATEDNGVWTVAEVQEVPVAPGAQTEPVDTQEAAEAEAAKVVPSVPAAVAEELTPAQEAAYTEMFEAKVVEVTVDQATKYAVEVVMKADVAEAIQAEVDAEAEDVAAAAVAAAAGESGTAQVTTTPGLYYVVEAGSDVDGIAPASCTLATGSTLDLTLPNKGEKGFYKLSVSVTPVAIQE